MEQTKVCGVCGKTLPISEFAKNAKAADGLSYRCNTCKKTWIYKDYDIKKQFCRYVRIIG